MTAAIATGLGIYLFAIAVTWATDRRERQQS